MTRTILKRDDHSSDAANRPIAIGDGISFFKGLDKDVALHLLETTAYDSGIVALRYEVRK